MRKIPVLRMVAVKCDRCGAVVQGRKSRIGSSGFYWCGSVWGRFMKPGEHIVCDACMQADPDYKREYGILDVQ